MGVYINGMDMPKSCEECPFYRIESSKYILPAITCSKISDFSESFVVWCGRTGRQDISYDSIPDFCPLTEVLEPHGPLVDEDLIRERAKYWLVGGTDGHTLNDFLNDFLNFAEITTVIERSNNE